MKEINRNEPWVLIVIMILVSTIGLMATDIYAPSLPLIPALFNTTARHAQWTVSFFLIGFAITQLLAGVLSDSFGRKPILIIGLLIFFSGTLLCIFSSSISVLFIGRIIQGIGAGGTSVLSRILLKDCFSGTKMAQIGSYIGGFIGLSLAIAPVIGGFLQEYLGFKSIFIFLFILALFLFYLVNRYYQETNRFKHLHQFSVQNILRKYKLVLSNSTFWVNVVTTGCTLAVIIVCAVINPFIIQNNLHVSTTLYGFYACIAMSGLFVGMFLNARFVEIYGIQRMILTGAVWIILGGIAFVLFSILSYLSVLIVIAPTFIITLATAFILPNAIVGAFKPFPEMAGTVGAVYGFVQMLITGLVSALIALPKEPNLSLLGVMLISLMTFSLGFHWFLEKRRYPSDYDLRDTQ